VRHACDLDPAFVDVLTTLRAREGNGPPLFSPAERIVANARRFARTPDERVRFARGVRLFSVNPAIAPEEPGQPKSVLFAGDVLYAAGFAAPVEGVRYAAAARWPMSGLFQPIGPAWARPGDLLVVGSEIEVITGVSGQAPRFTTLGARSDGLVEDDAYGRGLARARRHGDGFLLGRLSLHVLRVTVQGP
jgi:hypothetical protein